MLDQLVNPAGYPFWILIIAVIAVAVAILSRPFSTYVKFVYPNAKYESMGNPYVTEKNIIRLVESKTLNDFKDALNSSKDYQINGDDAYHIQKSFDDSFFNTVQMMKSDSSNKMGKFFNIYLEKSDMYLVKKELRNKLKNGKVDEKSIEDALLSSTKKLLYKIKQAERKNLGEILLDAGFDQDIAKELENQEIDYMEIDNEVDKYIINKFIEVTVPYKCSEGKEKFIKTYLDIYNIKHLLRCKQLGFGPETCMKYFNGEGREIAAWKYEQLSELDGVAQVINQLDGTAYYTRLKDSIEEYNKEKTVQILENRLDGLFLDLIKDISMKHYSTIGPTLRFLIFKEYEIQNLKVIAKGISEQLSSEYIKKFLVLEDAA